MVFRLNFLKFLVLALLLGPLGALQHQLDLAGHDSDETCQVCLHIGGLDNIVDSAGRITQPTSPEFDPASNRYVTPRLQVTSSTIRAPPSV